MIDRRAKLNVDAPYLLKKLMGVEHLLFRQRNTLDKRERTLTIDAWNESFSNRYFSPCQKYHFQIKSPIWHCESHLNFVGMLSLLEYIGIMAILTPHGPLDIENNFAHGFFCDFPRGLPYFGLCKDLKLNREIQT